MDVYCVGMYRSGSTWQYNVAGHLLDTVGCLRLGFVEAKSIYEEASGSDVTVPWRIGKTHRADRERALALKEGRAFGLYSYRDLRDVAVSLIHKVNDSFEAVIERGPMLKDCIANHAFWASQPGVLVQRYESIIRDPTGAVRDIAAHLGVKLESDEATALSQEYSLERNRERMNRFAETARARGVNLDGSYNYSYDADTLLAWNHIRRGETGTWRQELTARQIGILAFMCGTWLIEEGYEADYQWAEAALCERPREDSHLRSA